MRARRSALDASAAGLVPLHPTHYERLRVAENASPAAIDAAWQACLARWPTLHTPPARPEPSLALPGVQDAPALEQAALRLAFAVLRDPGRRAVYDTWLARERDAAALASARQRWWRRPRVAVMTLVLACLAGVLAWWFMSAG